MSPLADRAADAWIEGGAGTGGVTRSTRRTLMSSELQGKTVAFAVASEGTEQVELTDPWKAVVDAGGTPKLLSIESGTVQADDLPAFCSKMVETIATGRTASPTAAS